MFIEEKLYIEILNSIPLLCVDLIITDSKNRYLLVKRNNAPLKDEFWVPGGRVLLKENVRDSAVRLMSSELGLSCSIDKINLYGLYQDLFTQNAFQNNVNYHTVSVVFKVMGFNEDSPIFLDLQSSDLIWSEVLPDRLIHKMILF
jgi:colanic acid biosynthesis protein WcaH